MSTVAHESRTPTATAIQRRMELALGAVRGLTLAWAFVVAGIDARSGVLSPAAPALALLAVLAAWSVAWTVAVGRADRWVSGPGAAIDVLLAATVVAADQFVHGPGRTQSLGSAWPLVAVLATGVAKGPVWGLLGGTAVGATGIVAATVDGELSGQVLALCGATVLYAGGGWVATQLRSTAELAAAASGQVADAARRCAPDPGRGAAAVRRGAGRVGASRTTSCRPSSGATARPGRAPQAHGRRSTPSRRSWHGSRLVTTSRCASS
jgi:hypothetical protein